VVICPERGADCLPADAAAVPNPRRLLHHLNPDWFYLSGTRLPTQAVLEKRPLNGCSCIVVVVVVVSRWFITLHQRAPQSKVIESVGGVLHRAPAACVSEGRQAAAETTSYYVSKG